MHGRMLVSFAAVFALCGSAAAQPGGQVSPPLERKACAEHNLQGKADGRNGSQGDTPETQGRAPSDGSLSERLAQSGGVICPPPGLDPDIRAPAPGGGNTPVIPPPASREGAEPKPQ